MNLFKPKENDKERAKQFDKIDPKGGSMWFCIFLQDEFKCILDSEPSGCNLKKTEKCDVIYKALMLKDKTNKPTYNVGIKPVYVPKIRSSE